MVVEAVESVLAQTYPDLEVIVIDDGSTDETPGVIDDLAAGHPDKVRVLHVPNGGPGRAREAGRLVARGEFIQYLDSDDMLCPDKFRDQVRTLREHPECGVAYGTTNLVDENGAVLASPYKGSGEHLDHLFPALLVGRWWNTHTPLYRRSVCDAVGPWSDMRMGEDWEYDARVGALETRIVHCGEVVSLHRSHGEDRLTGHGLSAAVLADVARLVLALDDCSRRAGVPPGIPEMQHFSRWAFFTARETGAAGLSDLAGRCLAVARGVTRRGSLRRWDLVLYRVLAGCLGWRGAGLLSRSLDRRRSRPRADVHT